jgi:regulator of protease activity HflC (stomatin/prohibitin superfamily)
MTVQPAPNQFASMPQRRYAQPGDLHVSLGGPIRRIVWVVLVVLLSLAVWRLYGLPTRDNITGAVVFIAGLLIISIFTPGIRVAAQWEKGVILRLGRFAGLRGPGVFYVFPGLESALFVDTRLLTLDIPGQKAITKDNVPVQIDGALFFQVRDPGRAVVEVQDYRFATTQYAQSALRDVVGGLSLDDLLAEREQIQSAIRDILEQRTQSLGIHVDSVRLLDVDVPEDLKRMMSRQASAEREKRATITKAEGDKLAALNLSDAAATMLESPGAMQLRTLQTIDGLGASPSNTVILMPVELVDLMRGMHIGDGRAPAGPSAIADQAAPAARACRSCGRALDPGAKFCNACGAKVEN